MLPQYSPAPTLHFFLLAGSGPSAGHESLRMNKASDQAHTNRLNDQGVQKVMENLLYKERLRAGAAQPGEQKTLGRPESSLRSVPKEGLLEGRGYTL